MAVGSDPTLPHESGQREAPCRARGRDRPISATAQEAPGATSGQPARGGAPAAFAREDDHGEDGCGNAVPMETRERFPQGLGNLAAHARFPHSHKPIILRGEERQKNPEPVTKVSPIYPV